ncbi:MAG: VOC family protein [Vicinamibacterales bacterium]
MSTAATAGTTMYPFLRYRDAAAAIGWLGRAFGLEPRAVHPGPDNTIAHAELGAGTSVLMLGSAKDDDLGLKTAREVGAVTQGIYMVVADIDAHYARALAEGAEIVYPLRNTDYGSREYGARDLEGNLWSFGTYRPGAAA